MEDLVRTVSFGAPEDTPISFGSSVLHSLEDGNLNLFMVAHILTTVSAKHAKEALHSVMLAPSRLDYRERVYGGLEPSHRVALEGMCYIHYPLVSLLMTSCSLVSFRNGPSVWCILCSPHDSESMDVQQRRKAFPSR